MPNYELIKNNDPGGDIDDALIEMLALVQTDHPHRLTYISIANDLGFLEAALLEAAVATQIGAGLLPTWVHNALLTEGINVNNPQTLASLDLLVGIAGLTQETIDLIKELGEEPLFSTLKKGWIEQARIQEGLDPITGV